MRVAILGALFLTVGPLLVTMIGTPLLANLFVVGDSASMGLVAFVAVVAGWVCGMSIELVRLYAPIRMSDVPPSRVPSRGHPRLRLSGYSFLAFPLVACMWYRSSPSWLGLIIPAITIVVTTIVGLVLVRALWDKGERDARDNKKGILLTWFAAKGPWLTQGYLRPRPDGQMVIAPGHLVAVGSTVTLLIVWVVIGFVYTPGRFSFPQPPALVFALLLFMMNVTVLAGLSFFFDRFRVPLLFILIPWNALCLTTNASHAFLVYPVGSERSAKKDAAPTSDLVIPTAEQPLAGRPLQGPYRDTVVVVCASGGGIQAAAWTTRVLTWLNEDLGDDFTRATRFYSGVSGGSVGLMYFLDACKGGSVPASGLGEFIRKSSDEQSLSQVAWGLAYPDFARAWVPRLAPRLRNRAWALELAWRRHPAPGGSELLEASWSDWVRAAADGGFPGVVFNAFEITRGSRILINNVQIPGAVGALPITALSQEWKPGEPSSNHMLLDLDIVTAARVSASFPYVSPISTPAYRDGSTRKGTGPLPKLNPWAAADGGYFDNAGIMTAIEWIRAVDRTNSWAGVKRVVVVEIRAFPRSDQTPPPSALDRWKFSSIGPILGMLKTRTSSQIARNDLDLAMLKSEVAGRFEIEHVVFQPGNKPWPLSWQLSPNEIQALDEARTSKEFTAPRDRLRDLAKPTP